MIKHVYGITKTVSYMVHLIWYMEKKTCTKYCLYEKNMYRWLLKLCCLKLYNWCNTECIIDCDLYIEIKLKKNKKTSNQKKKKNFNKLLF